ncbi:SUMO-activating enzyme subunit 2-like [Amphiura filiformis]|uniref:SUMO-activating enzyme subunit 2-like n=1 Tax=Amphiura filiformis TaxID=82378 RepID=UPI003B21BC0B
MAASIHGVLPEDTAQMVNACRVLVVGAGGIGCELLKNLVLTGFHDIVVIDLDTIDVSNLNRQFLFHKKHVGKSKSQVAKESAQMFNPKAKIEARHDSVTNPEYNREFFRQFNIVMNALDNRAARNHVNRMCLAADVPLVESGTAGYLGQVTVIKKGLTECYECQPKPTQKTFPGCTIRNTPSEPIHCIVWAKHLFNQLFGEEDPDQDVSPDTADPEAAGDAGQSAATSTASTNDNAAGGVERTSTRTWAESTDYNPQKLFKKLFHDDVKYLLSMDKLWKKRRPPTPLDWDNLPQSESNQTDAASLIKDQRLWDMQECVSHFKDSLESLKQQYRQRGELAWDKDDDAAMDFVTCTANFRSYIFGIPTKTRFDVKSMAGNIIPAIATTNAVIAGLIVMEGLKVLSGHLDKCKTVYLNRAPNVRKRLLVPCRLETPNPECYVCSPKPEVTVHLNTSHVTVKVLEDKILKGELNMIAPDVEIDDGKGTILISSEEGETEENNNKLLSDFSIKSGSRLKADDFLQSYELVINIIHIDKLPEEQEYIVEGKAPAPEPAPTTNNAPTNNTITTQDSAVSSSTSEPSRVQGPAGDCNEAQAAVTTNGSNGDQAGPSAAIVEEDDDDDLIIMDDEDEEEQAQPMVAQTASPGKKRKLSDSDDAVMAKKAKVAMGASGDGNEEELVILDS